MTKKKYLLKKTHHCVFEKFKEDLVFISRIWGPANANNSKGNLKANNCLKFEHEGLKFNFKNYCVERFGFKLAMYCRDKKITAVFARYGGFQHSLYKGFVTGDRAKFFLEHIEQGLIDLDKFRDPNH